MRGEGKEKKKEEETKTIIAHAEQIATAQIIAKGPKEVFTNTKIIVEHSVVASHFLRKSASKQKALQFSKLPVEKDMTNSARKIV